MRSVEDSRMTLGEHFEELRIRLFRAALALLLGMGLCLAIGRYLLQAVQWPLAVATADQPLRLRTITVTEAFMTYLRVCLLAGAVLASPYMLHQMWQFIAAGLYEREQKAVRKYLLPSVTLFVTGVVFFMVVVAPLVIRFFVTFGYSSYPAPPAWGVHWYSQHILRVAPTTAPAATQAAQAGLEPMLRVGEYISFVTTLGLVFGVAFQTPLVVLFLGRSGIVSVQRMRRVRRYVFLIICIVSAIVTPADVGSMIALAVPMYLLYELGLFAAARKRRED